MAVNTQELGPAEIAFAQISEIDRLQYIAYIKVARRMACWTFFFFFFFFFFCCCFLILLLLLLLLLLLSPVVMGYGVWVVVVLALDEEDNIQRVYLPPTHIPPPFRFRLAVSDDSVGGTEAGRVASLLRPQGGG